MLFLQLASTASSLFNLILQYLTFELASTASYFNLLLQHLYSFYRLEIFHLTLLYLLKIRQHLPDAFLDLIIQWPHITLDHHIPRIFTITKSIRNLTDC